MANECLGKLAGASILVVEDSRINQQITEELLVSGGMRATIANNGQEAVDLLSHTHFDAVLMDLQMPVLDGFAATRIIRSRPALQGLPIIAMTADREVAEREKCLLAGMDDHVVKSLDPSPLYLALEKWVAREPSTISSSLPAGDGPDNSLPANILPDHLPGIDLSPGLKIVRGNAALLRKLLLDFYSGHKGDIAVIQQALALGDLALARRIAHTLVGTAGSLGAMEVQAAARVLDEAIKNDQSALLPELVVKLENAFVPVMDGLLQFAASQVDLRQNSGESAGFEIDTVMALIKELKALIEDYSPEAESKAQEIKCRIACSQIEPELANLLHEQLGMFDFIEAEHTLDQLVTLLKTVYE